MSADDISPEHGRLALFDQEFKQLLDIFHVQNAFSLFFRKRCAPSRSQVKGLVCADIEFIRPEQLHILINHFLNQGNGIPVGHIYRMVMHSVLKTESLFKAARQFTEMLEGPGLQQLIEMAECSDGRHQFHSSLIAVLIQFKHFFRGHGSLVPPQLGEITEQICMLHIELQLVHLIEGKDIHHFLHVFQSLNTSSGSIMVKASVFHIRLVVNCYMGKKSSALAHNLTQCLNGPSKGRQAAAAQECSFFLNFQSIVLLAQRSIHHQQDISLSKGSSSDLYCHSGPVEDFFLQLTGIDNGSLRTGSIHDYHGVHPEH